MPKNEFLFFFLFLPYSLSFFCWCFSLNYNRVVSSKSCMLILKLEAQFIRFCILCVWEFKISRPGGFSSQKSTNWDLFEQFSDGLLVYVCWTFIFKWKLSLGFCLLLEKDFLEVESFHKDMCHLFINTLKKCRH